MTDCNCLCWTISARLVSAFSQLKTNLSNMNFSENLLEELVGEYKHEFSEAYRRSFASSFQKNKQGMVVKVKTPSIADNVKEMQSTEMSDQASEVETLERVFADANALPIQMSYPLIEAITMNFAQVIGNGASGVVYLGGVKNGMVAVKKLSPSLNDLSDTKFLEEVKCLKKVKHKNIVRFLGYCADAQGIVMEVEGEFRIVDAPKRFLCFEYVPNGSLHDYIQEQNHGREWSIHYQIIKGICEGLHYLHEERIYHLDLKPANVLLGAHMEPKITDFGVSRCIDGNLSTISTDNCNGTRGYIAPELIDKRKISRKNDIYSLGIIMARILTGKDVGDIAENWHESLNADCQQMKTCIRIAKSCVEHDPSKRPNISEIVVMLNEGEATIQNVRPIVSEPRNDPRSSYYQVVKRFQEMSARTLHEHSRGKAPYLEDGVIQLNGDSVHSIVGTTVPNNLSEIELAKDYEAATQHDAIEKEAQELFEVDMNNKKITEDNNNYPIHLSEREVNEFKGGLELMNIKMHRYPPSILGLGDNYTMPRTVAIGPYHHCRQQLKQAEQAKQVAAYHCIRESGCSAREMFDAVTSVADNARRLYDKDVMAGIGYKDFQHMMFFDACFLVQYMVWFTDPSETDASLRRFFDLNTNGIQHDVILLENQIPWLVLEAVMKFRALPLDKFVAEWRGLLQGRQDLKDEPLVLDDDSYKPAHLLGLLRYCIVGTRKNTLVPIDIHKIESRSFSVSATELAQIGITLAANQTRELTSMGLHKKGIFADLSLVPLSLNYAHANRLVNMAALELCTTPNFGDAHCEESAVCSYLLLLSTLVQREEDVDVLRRQGILQQGSDLTNKEALDFFTSLRCLPNGLCVTFTMADIQSYRMNWKIMAHMFFKKNKKQICAGIIFTVFAVSAIGTAVGVIKKHS